jgi:hypothetical protein
MQSKDVRTLKPVGAVKTAGVDPRYSIRDIKVRLGEVSCDNTSDNKIFQKM